MWDKLASKLNTDKKLIIVATGYFNEQSEFDKEIKSKTIIIIWWEQVDLDSETAESEK